MANLENISLILGIISLALAILSALLNFLRNHRAMETKKRATRDRLLLALAVLGIILITTTIFSRVMQTGHGPFSSMYEFALAFAWGITIAGLIFHWRYNTSSILVMGLMIALLLLIFARVQYARPTSLVPALQQSALLSTHVASAVVAYGTLTIGFGAAVMFIIQKQWKFAWLPDTEVLDIISNRAVLIGFPFLTLLIILGALWADIAWGSYWSWDPKETASLVTWLIYAAYLHARIMRGWSGSRASILLIAGFAAILLTFFGNYIFTGLHAYG